MPNWNQILSEIQGRTAGPADQIRREYLQKLQAKTGRNIIAYYSGFQQKPGQLHAQISDLDKNGFMNAIHEMDPALGLDLILHTPGGLVSAAESIVDYLQQKFGNDIRAIVPHQAMSAGTMIALACKSIIMGRQSNLGPIDPRFGDIGAISLLQVIESAKVDLQAGRNIHYWSIMLSKFNPVFIADCQRAKDMAEEISQRCLVENMFSDEPEPEAKARRVVQYLLEIDEHKEHGRHIHFGKLKEIGLRVELLEDDQELQDLVLSVHHAFNIAFLNGPAIKIIENHMGRAIIHNVHG